MTAPAPATWDRDSIQALLERSDAAVVRALIVLYARQTSDEQATDSTRVRNNVGFTAFDAEILSSFAKQAKARGSLSPRQLAIARPKVKRYWRQLLDEIQARAAAATLPTAA